MKDLRNKITFIPHDCGVEGWTQIESDASVTAIYFDRPRDDERGYELSQLPPALLFENDLVRSSLLKFQAILNGAAPDESIYAETLGMLLALELSRLGGKAPAPPSPVKGGLTRRQVRQVVDYMNANLQNDIALTDLANLLALSRFHSSGRSSSRPACRRTSISWRAELNGRRNCWRSGACRSPRSRAGPAFTAPRN